MTTAIDTREFPFSTEHFRVICIPNAFDRAPPEFRALALSQAPALRRDRL